MGKYRKVQQRKFSIGKWCMRCKKSATVTAIYKSDPRHEMNVWFCIDHAKEAKII